MPLRIGEVVITNYGTGPYRIVEISEPCNCPRYEDEISMPNAPASESHYHLTCRPIKEGSNNRGPCYLNGFRQDGTNVWSDDILVFEGAEKNMTPDMFGPR